MVVFFYLLMLFFIMVTCLCYVTIRRRCTSPQQTYYEEEYQGEAYISPESTVQWRQQQQGIQTIRVEAPLDQPQQYQQQQLFPQQSYHHQQQYQAHPDPTAPLLYQPAQPSQPFTLGGAD